METLASFMVELALPEYSMLRYSGSLLAAGAVMAAVRTLGSGNETWTPALARHSGYGEAEVRVVAGLLASLQRKAPTATLLAVHKKYTAAKFLEIARVAPNAMLADEGELAVAAARAGPVIVVA